MASSSGKSEISTSNLGRAFSGKTFVGPRLRQLRRDHGHTQADMASRLGVSAAYINLMEHNQRSLSVRVLVGLLESYGVDWQDLVNDVDNKTFDDLRNVLKDPFFGEGQIDPREMRAAIDNAPNLVENFLRMHGEYRNLLENVMRIGNERMPDELLASSAETVVHDFFRNNSNYFPGLEQAASQLRSALKKESDMTYMALRQRLHKTHGIDVVVMAVEKMGEALRVYDEDQKVIHLSEGLDHINRVFQLAHVLCFLEFTDVLDSITDRLNDPRDGVVKRCQVELANYFSAALLMPYDDFVKMAKETRYDIDRLAARFEVSFEQVCHRLTTLQKDGNKGVPFFFLRVDKAGNVSKRFNATTFQIAEFGGACPVWNLHTAFRTPGVVIPQFVELPDGERFFTISRTTERPAFSRDTQDRRLVLSLGCSVAHIDDVIYANAATTAARVKDQPEFAQIGINCHLCPREGCSQRAHQPLMTELTIDPNRRGGTRYDG